MNTNTHGGRRPGAGAPIGNFNAFKHGHNSDRAGAYLLTLVRTDPIAALAFVCRDKDRRPRRLKRQVPLSTLIALRLRKAASATGGLEVSPALQLRRSISLPEEVSVSTLLSLPLREALTLVGHPEVSPALQGGRPTDIETVVRLRALLKDIPRDTLLSLPVREVFSIIRRGPNPGASSGTTLLGSRPGVSGGRSPMIPLSKKSSLSSAGGFRGLQPPEALKQSTVAEVRQLAGVLPGPMKLENNHRTINRLQPLGLQLRPAGRTPRPTSPGHPEQLRWPPQK